MKNYHLIKEKTINKPIIEKNISMREQIQQAIIGYIQEHGYSPSFREIGEKVGLKSTSSVYHHISIMLKNGMLETDHGIGASRAIRIPGYEFVKRNKE